MADRASFLKQFSIVLVMIGFCGGCGLLGIELFPEPVTYSAQLYTAPFVCESDEDGTLVSSTAMLLHNREAGEVSLLRRATLFGSGASPEETSWSMQLLESGQAVRLDCDRIARIISGDSSATFNSEFEAGSRIEGFLTVGIEADDIAPRLDASVQYDHGNGSLEIEPVTPSLVVVDTWPPLATNTSPN